MHVDQRQRGREEESSKVKSSSLKIQAFVGGSRHHLCHRFSSWSSSATELLTMWRSKHCRSSNRHHWSSYLSLSLSVEVIRYRLLLTLTLVFFKWNKKWRKRDAGPCISRMTPFGPSWKSPVPQFIVPRDLIFMGQENPGPIPPYYKPLRVTLAV